MKKILIALFAVVGLAQADCVQIDFGRYDSQTDDFYNIHTAKKIYVGQAGANFVNGKSSATTTHKLKLGARMVRLTYRHTTGIRTGGLGMMPTLTPNEEKDWKNPYTGKLPAGVNGNVRDAITTQMETGKGTHSLTFRGLEPGTYSLTGFGAYYGKDKMSSIRVFLGKDLTADWTGQSCTSDTWSDCGDVEEASGIYFPGDVEEAGNRGYYFCADNVTVGKDGILSLTIAGEMGDWSRTPLNYISLQKTFGVSVTVLVLISLVLLGLIGGISWVIYRRRRR